MYILLLFLIGIPGWSAMEDVLEVNRSRKELQHRNSTWREGHALLFVQKGIPLIKDLTPKKYLEMPVQQRVHLKKSMPHFIELEKIVGMDGILEFERKLIEEEEKVLSRYTDPEKIKGVVRLHFEKDAFISEDFLDRLIGLNYETEKALDEMSYPGITLIGIPKRNTQTWYDEVRTLFQGTRPEKGSVFYDLGSGYGRVGIYGAINFPEVTFKGIELVKERVSETNKMASRLNLKNAIFIENDVLKADFSDGTHFYMFNPFPEIMPQVLKRLENLAKKKKITIITLWEPGLELMRQPWVKLKGEPSGPRFLRVFESK